MSTLETLQQAIKENIQYQDYWVDATFEDDTVCLRHELPENRFRIKFIPVPDAEKLTDEIKKKNENKKLHSILKKS